jgi:hypothetical protein
MTHPLKTPKSIRTAREAWDTDFARARLQGKSMDEANRFANESNRYKVSFEGGPTNTTGGHYPRIERTNEMSIAEAQADMEHLKRLGYKGIRLVPVREARHPNGSFKASAHPRHLRMSAESASDWAAIEAAEASELRRMP